MFVVSLCVCGLLAPFPCRQRELHSCYLGRRSRLTSTPWGLFPGPAIHTQVYICVHIRTHLIYLFAFCNSVIMCLSVRWYICLCVCFSSYVSVCLFVSVCLLLPRHINRRGRRHRTRFLENAIAIRQKAISPIPETTVDGGSTIWNHLAPRLQKNNPTVFSRLTGLAQSVQVSLHYIPGPKTEDIGSPLRPFGWGQLPRAHCHSFQKSLLKE